MTRRAPRPPYARRAIAYRGTGGCIVESDADRLSIQLLDTFAAKIGGRAVESDDVVTAAGLDSMAATGAAFSELLWSDSEVAS